MTPVDDGKSVDAEPVSQRSVRRWARLVEVVLFASVVLAPLWLVDSLPTIDGPQHTFGGWAINHLGRDAGSVGELYVRRTPLTSMSHEVLVAGLEKLVGIRAAERLALSVLVLVVAFGSRAVALVAAGGRTPWRWLTAVTPYCAAFYFGFFNYEMGVGLGLWFLAVVLRLVPAPDRATLRPPARELGFAAAVLLVASFAHVFAVCVAGLVAGVALAAGTAPRRWTRLLVALGASSLPALVWVVRVAVHESAYQQSSVADQLTPTRANVVWLYRNLYENPIATMHLVNALVLFAVLACVVAVARSRATLRQRGLLAATLLCAVAALLLPDQIDAWKKLPIRFATWVALLAPALIPAPRAGSKLARHSAWAAPLLTVVLALQSLSPHEELAALRTEFEAGIGEQRGSARMAYYIRPVEGDGYRIGDNAMVNMHLWYSMEERVAYPFVFAGRSIHAVARSPRYRERMPSLTPSLVGLPPEIHAQVEARRGLRFDQVLAWDPSPAQLDALAAHGYTLAFRRGGLWRFAPPARRLTMVLSAVPEGSWLAAVLFSDLLWPYELVRLDVREDRGEVTAAAQIERLPAMPVRVVLARETAGAEPEAQHAIDVDLTKADRTIRQAFPAANR